MELLNTLVHNWVCRLQSSEWYPTVVNYVCMSNFQLYSSPSTNLQTSVQLVSKWLSGVFEVLVPV